MIFRQLFDKQSSTFTYLLADEKSGDAVLIDTVFEQHLRDLALVRELGLTLRWTLDTHVHADHVTGAWLMHEALGSGIAASAAGGATAADRTLEHGDEVQFGDLALHVRATPGHTAGCLTFVLGDRSMAFTGDALLIRGSGRCDFQEGDAAALFRSVREQILSLPEACMLYPGHDYRGRGVTTVGEERAHNPRLGDGKRERDFVGYMENLMLPHPKQMDAAVPANLVCGRPRNDQAAPTAPTWAPVVRSYAGIWEVDPHWVHEQLGAAHIIDVREHKELESDSLGWVPGAEVIPLNELRERAGELPTDRPLITTCASGARSAQAASILESAGLSQVANLPGGLIQWLALGFETERGSSIE